MSSHRSELFKRHLAEGGRHDHYVFIESRDPFESRDTQFVEETATALKQRGHEVSTTAFRIISAALKKGIHVNVFAYEGAVCLASKGQAPHANPVKGTTVEEEEHPTTRAFVASLLKMGGRQSAANMGELRAVRRRARSE